MEDEFAGRFINSEDADPVIEDVEVDFGKPDEAPTNCEECGDTAVYLVSTTVKDLYAGMEVASQRLMCAAHGKTMLDEALQAIHVKSFNYLNEQDRRIGRLIPLPGMESRQAR